MQAPIRCRFGALAIAPTAPARMFFPDQRRAILANIDDQDRSCGDPDKCQRSREESVAPSAGRE